MSESRRLPGSRPPSTIVGRAVAWAAASALALGAACSPAGPSTSPDVPIAPADAAGADVTPRSDASIPDGDAGSGDAGVRPTEANTGPRHALADITPAAFFSARSCDRQRINGNVDFDQAWMRGQTFTLTDCEVTGRVQVYLRGGGQQLPMDEMPVIRMDHVRVRGGVHLNNAVRLTIDHSYIFGGQWTLTDQWTPFVEGPAPIAVSNTVFYRRQGAPPDHTEALHVAHYGSGYRFTNVAFIQQGPNNGSATATINFHGRDTVFDGCWFLWDGPPAAYYVVYIDGANNRVQNSWFASGAGYVYPDSETQATYSNNRNVDTGEPIALP